MGNRITRIRERCEDLFGAFGTRGASFAPATPTSSPIRNRAGAEKAPKTARILLSPKIRQEPLIRSFIFPCSALPYPN